MIQMFSNDWENCPGSPTLSVCEKNSKTPIVQRSGNAAPRRPPNRRMRTPHTSPGWPSHFPVHEIKGGCPSNQRSATLSSNDHSALGQVVLIRPELYRLTRSQCPGGIAAHRTKYWPPAFV